MIRPNNKKKTMSNKNHLEKSKCLPSSISNEQDQFPWPQCAQRLLMRCLMQRFDFRYAGMFFSSYEAQHDETHIHKHNTTFQVHRWRFYHTLTRIQVLQIIHLQIDLRFLPKDQNAPPKHRTFDNVGSWPKLTVNFVERFACQNPDRSTNYATEEKDLALGRRRTRTVYTVRSGTEITERSYRRPGRTD